MCPPNSHSVKIQLLSFLGRYKIPEWFVRSESSSVLKLIPSAQQYWPEQSHRDRSKDVNKVYCNIFHGIIAAPTKSFWNFCFSKTSSPCNKDNICDHRVTKNWEVGHLGANNSSHTRSWIQQNNIWTEQKYFLSYTSCSYVKHYQASMPLYINLVN